MEGPTAVLTASGILFGFLFSGFWWALNRELKFKPDQRHFKPGYFLLLASMCLVGYFGLIVPLNLIVEQDPSLAVSRDGFVLVLVVLLGYILVEFGHYSVFQLPKYTTKSEWIALASTAIAAIVATVFLFLI